MILEMTAGAVAQPTRYRHAGTPALTWSTASGGAPPSGFTYRKLVTMTVATRITDLCGWLLAILLGGCSK